MAKSKAARQSATLAAFDVRNGNAILHLAVRELARLQGVYSEGILLAFEGKTARDKKRGDNLIDAVEYQWQVFHQELDAADCGMEIASYFVQKDLARLTAGGKAVIIMPKDPQKVGIQR